MTREGQHRPGRLTPIGASVLALFLVLLIMDAPTYHAHRATAPSLFDDACPDLRLAISADSAGPPAPRLAEAPMPLPTGESLNVAAVSVVPDVRPAQTYARAPPRLA